MTSTIAVCRYTLVVLSILLSASEVCRAEIGIESELEARILIDNSGSMYPGYAPPGGDGPTLAESGGLYYAHYPEFATWINGFVAAQTILGVGSVSLATFTSTGRFEPVDVQFLHQPGPLGAFDFARLRPRLPATGKHTYLSESLQEATRGFEGILWLVTDNIVEDRRGVPDQGVKRFFQTLAGWDRYRAVHLYKLPFKRLVEGEPGNLAIYGILVSSSAVDRPTLRYFDNKFRGAFLAARQGGSGRLLFPDEAYWKLKDVNIGAVDLEVRPTLQVEIVQQDRKLFRERQRVKLRLLGSVTSRLTQHRIVGGQFEIRPQGAFTPSGNEGKSLGLEPVPGSHFDSARHELAEIPPRGSARIEGVMTSNRPIPLEVRGLAWLKSASQGVQVTFAGQAEAHFMNLVARFDRRQMDGIFGADAAPEIFQIPNEFKIRVGVSNAEPVSFELRSGYGSQLLFVLLVLLALTLITGMILIFGTTAKYQARIAGDEHILAVRRLGSKQLEHQGYGLGRIVRSFLGHPGFEPNRDSAAVRVKASSDRGTYEVTIREAGTHRLDIHEIGGGPVGVVAEAGAPPRESSSKGREVRPVGRGSAKPQRIRRPPGGRSEESTTSSAGPSTPTSPPASRSGPGVSTGPAPRSSRPDIRRPR